MVEKLADLGKTIAEEDIVQHVFTCIDASTATAR
jgi:hypothetical protein